MKIFLVDDEPMLRMLIADDLTGPERAISEYASGKALLAAIDEAPDLILLDIEMPDMDGITACRAWRDAGHEDTQIIFISSHDDLEIRLKAYDAGGNDFIVKPFEAAELQRKVRVAEATLKQKSALAEQASFAGQTAFTAMSTIGEMGVIQQFMRASFAASSIEAVVAAMFEALQQYGVPGLVEVRLGIAPRRFSASGCCTPLEEALLGHAATMERIFQFHDRMAINYPAVTLLLTALPLDDPDRVGRLRDHLAVLVEGAHTRLQALETEQAKATQSLGISQALTTLVATLEEVERNQAAYRLRAAEIDTNYLRDLVNAFVHLGLSEDQENRLADMAQRTHGELAELRDMDGTVSDKLRAVVGQLRKLMGG